MQKLIFFVGIAGTGKTTVAKQVASWLPSAFLDRDTVGGRFVEAFLREKGMDPHDRDSPFYKQTLRDLEYDTTRDLCVENLAAGQHVLMISPFTSELKQADWIDQVLHDAGKTADEVDVKIVVVTLTDAHQQKERIASRQTVRDTWKLENWHSYTDRVQFVPDIRWNLPSSNVLIFDNSGTLTDEKKQQLRTFLQQ